MASFRSTCIRLLLLPALMGGSPGAPASPDVPAGAPASEALAGVAVFAKHPEYFADQTPAPELRRSAETAAETEGMDRRGFLQSAGAAISMLYADLAAAETKSSWPANPAWNVHPALTPVPIPADIETVIQLHVSRTNGNLDAAQSETARVFLTSSDPAERERTLIAHVLITCRLIDQSPEPAKTAYKNSLASLFASPSGKWLVNHRDLLNRAYGALLGPNYETFRRLYRYDPVDPTEATNGLNELGMLRVILPLAVSPSSARIAPYWQRLRDAGIEVTLAHFQIISGWALAEPLDGPTMTHLLDIAERLGKERLLTTQALLQLPLVTENGPAGWNALRTPDTHHVATQLDRFFGTTPVQFDELRTLLLYKNYPGFKDLLDHPSRYARFFLSIGPNRVANFITLVQMPHIPVIAEILDDTYGYEFEAADLFGLQQLLSKDDFNELLARAKRIFGDDVPVDGNLLKVLGNLRNVTPESEAFLARLHRETGGPAPEHALPWLDFTPTGADPEAIWATIHALTALGWRPTTEQPAYLAQWAQSPQMIATVRRLYPAGWRIYNLHDIVFYAGLTNQPATVERLAELRGRASPARYLENAQPALSVIFGNPELLATFIELHKRGLAFDFSLADDVGQPLAGTYATYVFSVLQQVNAEVKAHGWGALERLQRYTAVSVFRFLVHQRPLVRISEAALGVAPTVRLQIDVRGWIADDMLGTLKTLHDRTGYQLTVGDQQNALKALAADTAGLRQAEDVYGKTGVPLNLERKILLRDPHLRGMLEDPKTLKLLALLESKGYVFRVRDVEFIYHLARRSRWVKFIRKERAVTPDLYDIKRAYFREQLERPEFQKEIRDVLSLDMANPYTEFGGFIGFKENGDLELIALPSLNAPAKDRSKNVQHAIRPIDAEELLWTNGRYFAHFHNHALGTEALTLRPSTPDRAFIASFDDIFSLSILFAASPGATGRIVAGLFTKDRAGEIAGELGWTGRKVYGKPPIRANDPLPVPAHYRDEPFIHVNQTGSPHAVRVSA